MFLLYSSFFYIYRYVGIKWCTPYLVTCHCGFQALIRMLSKLLKILKSRLRTLMFVLLHQTSLYVAWTLCGIPFLHGHCCTVLMHNFDAMDSSQIVTAQFAKINCTIPLAFTSVPDGMRLTSLIIVDLCLTVVELFASFCDVLLS